MRVLFALWIASLSCVPAHGSDRSVDVERRLQGFDAYMRQTLQDWNGVGIGVGIVVGDKLVFARGYGYRDYGRRLPVTPKTLFQIASNTKLFTAVAAGLLVEEGQLAWDKPIRESVPSIKFYSDSLNNATTLRDMLAHRTGITRHDFIWIRSDFSNADLFDRLRYLEPATSPRQAFLYNNLMYAAVGHIIELKSGMSWQDYVQTKILSPLEMRSTVFSITDMMKSEEAAVPYEERRDSNEFYKTPYLEETPGLASAGSIVSSIEDMSHWLIALMNDGQYQGKQVLPARVIKATLEPAIPMQNTTAEAYGWWELQNPVQGMGRHIASYRGHLLTYHGGALPGFHSQVSLMPLDHIGVIVFTIGDHAARLNDPISYNVYERLLGLSQTPWTERWLSVRKKEKLADGAARAQAGSDHVSNTQPSHPLADYAGEYENPAYGVLRIQQSNGQLQFNFHRFQFPLLHYHYDRFDTPNDQQWGSWAVNFSLNPQGDVDRASISFDGDEVAFVRRPPSVDSALLHRLAGTYESASGAKFQIVVRPDGGIQLVSPGRPDRLLTPYKDLRFRSPESPDVIYEFLMQNGRVTALKQTDPNGEYRSKREQQ